jgi:hypothetical protein
VPVDRSIFSQSWSPVQTLTRGSRPDLRVRPGERGHASAVSVPSRSATYALLSKDKQIRVVVAGTSGFITRIAPNDLA